MDILGSIDRLAEKLEQFAPTLRTRIPELTQDVSVYRRIHPDIGRMLGYTGPCLYVEGTYAAGIERDSPLWEDNRFAEMVVTVSCSTRIENYQDTARLRDGMVDALFNWAEESGYRPRLSYLGAQGNPSEPRAWNTYAMLLMGQVDK